MYKRALISTRALCLGRSIPVVFWALLAPAYALLLWEMEKLNRFGCVTFTSIFVGWIKVLDTVKNPRIDKPVSLYASPLTLGHSTATHQAVATTPSDFTRMLLKWLLLLKNEDLPSRFAIKWSIAPPRIRPNFTEKIEFFSDFFSIFR